MADSSALGDLLDRAGKVFSLAGDLGRAFNEEHRRQRQQGKIDRSSWDRHASMFHEFGEAILSLRDAMENPPDGFGRVVEQLLKAANIAAGIWDTRQEAHGRNEATYLDFFPHLNSLFNDGWEAIEKMTKATPSANPFSISGKPPAGNQSDIDTTPTLPEPPVGYVDAAGRDIPGILANVEPRQDGTIEMIASHLAKRLQDAGHTLAAAHWAVHEAVRADRLVSGRIEVELPSFGKMVGGAMGPWGGPNDRRMEWSGGQKGTISIPKGKPAPFDNFKVTATEMLWAWWRSIAREPAVNRESAASTAPIPSTFESALRDAQVSEERNRKSQAAEGLKQEQRERVSEAWERIYQTRPSRPPGQPKNPLPPNAWQGFAEAIIEFCCVARDMGYEQQLSRAQGSKQSEIIALGIIASGFDKNLASLAELISRAPVSGGWLTWFNNDLPRSWLGEVAPQSPVKTGESPEVNERPVEPKTIDPKETKQAPKTKRTPRGAATDKLIGALTKWHDYATGSCLNLTPVGVRQLATLADVDPSTASDFFKREFKGYGKYEAVCKDVHSLVAVLKLLNDEYAPHHFLQVEPSDGAKDEDP